MCCDSVRAAGSPTMPWISLASSLAMNPTTFGRPMTFTPSLITFIAAITTGMNSSSSAVGGRAGSAAISCWASRCRPASRAAYGPAAAVGAASAS